MLQHRSMPYRRLALMALAAVMLVALLAACGKKESATVIATYNNGGQVTDKEFDKYIAFQTLMGNQMALYASIPQIKEQIIKQYILSKVKIDEVSDEKKKEAQKAADDFENTLKTQRNTQPDLKSFLDESNLSVKEATTFYKELLQFQSYYETKEKELMDQVTDDEIKAEYDKAPSDYNVVTVRHILIGTSDPNTGEELNTEEEAEKLAYQVKDKLEAGGDWDALAKEYSTDAGSKENGGLYSDQVAKGWVVEFKEAANEQAIGAIGEPVATQFGYHVIKVESRDEASSFDKLSDQAKDLIRQELSATKLNDFLTAEQDKLGITITLPEEPAEGETEAPDETETPDETPGESPSASPDASPSASAE
ncbi:peptidylprolyl isomerase [Paenibacillaceae bacterium WGS1546]|uniref:peptidylprolyl isomerase n=1 Tax=Cohnella sp. WGS1546 TaxID=3366810 RepID=UPI00372D704D